MARLSPSMSFAELRAIFVQKQRKMSKLRRLEPEKTVQNEMLGGAVEPLLSSDDVAYLHRAIIDDRGEVVGREAVRFQQNLIIHLSVGDLDLPVDQIPDSRLPLRDPEPEDVGFPCGFLGLDILRGQVEAVPVVPCVAACLGRQLPHRVETLPGAEARVGMPTCNQFLERHGAGQRKDTGVRDNLVEVGSGSSAASTCCW